MRSRRQDSNILEDLSLFLQNKLSDWLSMQETTVNIFNFF